MILLASVIIFVLFIGACILMVGSWAHRNDLKLKFKDGQIIVNPND